jgi:cobalt-zinc-cadmium efflux system membrane fusion protein
MTFDRRLYGGIGAAVLLASAAGFGLAKCTAKPGAPEKPTPTVERVHSADTVLMTPQAIGTAGIVVQPVSTGGLSAEILSQGTVAASPGGQAVLTAHAAGAVTRIYKRLGDPVHAGETLAVVESRDAAQLAADRSTAQAKAVLAQRTLAREKSLFEQRVSPRVDYEQAQAGAAAAAAEARRAQAAAGAAHVTADGRGVAVSSPISGRITSASASLGAYVQPETELFRVADPRHIQIEAAVSGGDAARIAPGDLAIVELPNGATVNTLVRSVTPSLNAETRAATAVLDLAGGPLQPGQSVRVRIRPKVVAASTAIVLPDEAVQSVNGREVVFLRTDHGFQAWPVVVGRRSAGRVEIAEGLRPGQAVATRNAFLLKAEMAKGEGEGD